MCGFGEGPGRERSSFDLNGCRSSDSGVFDDNCIGGTHSISVCGEYDDYHHCIIYKIISILFDDYDDDHDEDDETWIDFDAYYVNVFWYFLFVCVLLHYIYDDDDRHIY